MSALVRKTGISFLLVFCCAVLALFLAAASRLFAPSDSDNGKFERSLRREKGLVKPQPSGLA